MQAHCCTLLPCSALPSAAPASFVHTCTYANVCGGIVYASRLGVLQCADGGKEI